MATIQMDASGLIKSLENVSKNLQKELKIVFGKTARRSKSIIAKDVAKELAVTQKVIKSQLTVKTVGIEATVTLKKSARIPLRDFKARQIKKGVSYRISKTKGRKTIQGAFQGSKPGVRHPKWNGRVFKRVGKSRLPIQQLFGPSPWGVFTKNKRSAPVKKQIEAEMQKQLRERVRFKKLKQSGAI